ncbi:hypothetical protein LR48_Vigan454s001000 [Vigna angularis]|uniref:Uncharacterized protein n=1 Tax=Phaseolus angularis TaxID=3914 RepID=A0A0L9TBF4_PHAAN|nr:hypothetical protein LR48_Vigan454s001000 [Vigna angularis]
MASSEGCSSCSRSWGKGSSGWSHGCGVRGGGIIPTCYCGDVAAVTKVFTIFVRVTGDGGEGVTGEGVPGDGGEGVPGDGGVVGERGEGTNGLQLKELQSTGSEPRITLSLPHITHTKPRNDVQSTLFIGSCFKNPRALGCVRGHGLGPCPSKVFGVNVRSRSTSSTSSSNAELQTQVSSLTSQVNEMKAMITLLLQNQQGPLPSQFTTFDPSPVYDQANMPNNEECNEEEQN